MATFSFNKIFLLFLGLIAFFHSSCNATLSKKSPLTFPVKKDSATNQYYTSIDLLTPSVSIETIIDLGGQFLWIDCDQYQSSTFKKVSCSSSKCKKANNLGCLGCDSSPRLGCTNNTCGMSLYNPIGDIATISGLIEDNLHVNLKNGLKNSPKNVKFPFLCTSTFALEKLANGTKGMLGLSRSNFSFSTKLASTLKLPNKFALCLPSSSNYKNISGDIVIGGGSSYSTNELISTPLIINPVSTAAAFIQGEPSDEYFIDVKSITVGGTALKLNASLLSITKQEGVGGTKLSTTTPYTTLQSSIYNALVKAFVSKASSMGIKRVASEKPFGACFSSKTVPSDKYGSVVPAIDLVMKNETVIWRILGRNSMVEVNKDVMCLGFVDGGLSPRTSIVIGGRQLEDNVLEFDLDSSLLRFRFPPLFLSCTHI